MSLFRKEKSPFMVEGWQEYVGKLKKLGEELCLKYVQSHSPVGNPLSENGFEALFASTVRSIEVCGMLGIENIVVHAGWRDGIGKEEFFALNRDFYSKLFPVMEKYGVNVLIENSTVVNMGQHYYFMTGREMKEFIAYVGHPLLHACWDTGHANVEGHQYEDILALSDDLRALHINDNSGSGDQHIAPFMGTLNMDEVMRGLIDIDYKGYFTFEASAVVKNGKRKQTDAVYDTDPKLCPPPFNVFKAMVRFLYEIGKATLEEYGVFEE